MLSFHDIYCLTVGFSIAPSHDVTDKESQCISPIKLPLGKTLLTQSILCTLPG